MKTAPALGPVSLKIATNDALGRFAQVCTGVAKYDPVLHAEDCGRELLGFFLGHADQMVCQALCAFRPDAGQPVKRLDEAGDWRCGGWCSFRGGHEIRVF